MAAIEQIIDLDRYPIDRPDAAAYQALLDRGRAALERAALFAMPRFLRAEVVPRMAAELEALLPLSTRYQRPRNAYTLVETENDWPSEHPRNLMHSCAYNQVLNFQIPNNSALRQVYYWQPLAEFLRILCGYDSFYRSDCPHLALSAIPTAGITIRTTSCFRCCCRRPRPAASSSMRRSYAPKPRKITPRSRGCTAIRSSTRSVRAWRRGI